MSKEVQMTIRIEPELRARFAEAASRDHRPASQVLRELMRGYIRQVGEKDRVPANDGNSMRERSDREEAVNFGRASVALEGFGTSADLAAQQQRYIDGEIGLDELLRLNGMEPEPGYPAA
ncbi:antitoxin VbhA family protein [Variovorax sp. PvP013]|uniref:antitoxin VbhA family protein n=1 Tax=Variovorax sp. PvP013 TaxID=3156435 RepID=UPI003D1D383F